MLSDTLIACVSGVRYGHTYLKLISKKPPRSLVRRGFCILLFCLIVRLNKRFIYSTGLVGRVAVSGIIPLNILAPSPVSLK